MAVKTFSTGEVLTASDTNTYLANAGLVYVTSTTIGTAVSSVTVSNCFSSTYDNYRVLYSGGTASADMGVSFQLGPTSVSGYNTSYYGGMPRVDAAGAASNLGTNNQALFNYAGMGSTDALFLDIDVFMPALTKFTLVRTSWIDTRTNNAWGVGAGVHRIASAFSGFVLAPSAGTGTFTGGTITVYGYRKA